MRRILAVDDDPHICLAVRAWLKRYGFKVAIADGGTAGLVALDDSTFDLMIVDIFMPGMRGFESIRVFHDHAPTVPLIAISGYAFSSPETSSPDFLRMALKLGATRCLRKPFRPTTLLSVIDVPVGGRTSPQVCRYSGRRCERGVGIPGHDAVIGQVKRGCLQLRQAFRHRRCPTVSAGIRGSRLRDIRLHSAMQTWSEF